MSQKIPKYFECKKCNYITSNKKDYNKHVLTLKHQNTTNTTKVVPNACKEYRCYCGKVYKHHSSLWNHKKICVEKIPITHKTYNRLKGISNYKREKEYKDVKEFICH